MRRHVNGHEWLYSQMLAFKNAAHYCIFVSTGATIEAERQRKAAEAPRKIHQREAAEAAAAEAGCKRQE